MRLAKHPLLVIAGCLAALVLLGWSVRSSGILDLLRGDPSDDPERLRGTVVELVGNEARDPAKAFDLAGLRGAPLLVCRMQPRGGLWLLDVIGRWRRDNPALNAVVVVAFRAGDEIPPAVILAKRPELHGVLVDDITMSRWGFDQALAEMRLVDAEGRVRSANLAAGNDRDTTLKRLTEIWPGK